MTKLCLRHFIYYCLFFIGSSAATANPCFDLAKQHIATQGVLELVRGDVALGGFSYGITEQEILSINQGYGGSIYLNGHISSVFAAASYQEGFYRKAAAVIRGIAKNHLFDNGNKRTAHSVYEVLRIRNGIRSGVQGEDVRRVIDQVVSGELEALDDIASALRGFD